MATGADTACTTLVAALNTLMYKSPNPNLKATLNLSLGNEMFKVVILINKYQSY